MGWMIPHPERLPDHLCDPCRGPDLATKPERFGSLCQQGWQLGALILLQFRLRPWRRLMSQGLDSLCSGFLSLFMQFPGTHPSSFAPIFGKWSIFAHTSFSRPFWSGL